MPLEKAGVDQSGNIDRTNNDTAIVYCPLDNEKPNYKLFIPRDVSSSVRERIKPNYEDKGRFITKLYAACLYYLLRDVTTDINEIVMEEEYTGKMDHIINTTCNWIRDRDGREASVDQFTIQPRQPNFAPDTLAKKVLRNEVNPDEELSFRDFDRLM